MVSKKLINTMKSCPATSGLIEYVKKIENIESNSGSGTGYDDSGILTRLSSLENGMNNLSLRCITVETEGYDIYVGGYANNRYVNYSKCTPIFSDESTGTSTFLISNVGLNKIVKQENDEIIATADLIYNKNLYRLSDFEVDDGI